MFTNYYITMEESFHLKSHIKKGSYKCCNVICCNHVLSVLAKASLWLKSLGFHNQVNESLIKRLHSFTRPWCLSRRADLDRAIIMGYQIILIVGLIIVKPKSKS